METYSVELFGLTNDLAGLRHVEVALDDEATLGDLVAGLRRAAPALEGRVIKPGENKLTSHYAFNINGRFRVDEYDSRVTPRDHIVLLTFALGG